MASGELFISVFPDYVMLELLKVRGNTRTLVMKQYEDIKIPLRTVTKGDLLTFEKSLSSFIGKSTIKKGKINIVVFGNREVSRYDEFELNTSRVRDMKNLLGFEIDSMGEQLKGFKHLHKFVGSVAQVHFLRESLVTSLSDLKLPKNWEIDSIVPGYEVLKGLNTGDRGLVLDVGRSNFYIYAYDNGVLKDSFTARNYDGFDPKKETGDLDYFTNLVSQDVQEFMVKYRVENPESPGFDELIVVRNANLEDTFEDVMYDELLYRGYRNSINPIDVELMSTKDTKLLNRDVSPIVYGFLSSRKELTVCDFSPEKLGMAYRDLLTGSLAFSVMLAVSLPAMSIWTGSQLDDRQDELISYQQSLLTSESTIRDLNGKIKSMDKKISNYNAYVSSLERLNTTDRNFVSKLLGFLPDNTPSSIYFESISMTKGTKDLVVQGVSKNYKDIGSFAIQLEQVGKVKINDIQDNELLNMKGYPFEIELKSN